MWDRKRQACAGAALLAAWIGMWPAVTAAGEFFDGVGEAGKPLMEQACRRIEEIRKGSFTIRLTAPDGSPVTRPAEVQLLQHEFQFGASLTGFAAALDDSSPLSKEAFEVVAELFSMASLGDSWKYMEPKRGGSLVWDRTDRNVAWAARHGMGMRFHCLIYNYDYAVPLWSAEVETTDEWWPLIENCIRAVAARYGDKVGEYNVINEMVLNDTWAREHNPTFPSLADPANGARIFRLARKYLPKATLVSLEAGLATTAPTNEHFQEVYRYQKALLDLGAPVDVIGFQGHFFAGDPPFQQGHPKGGPDAFTMKGICDGLDRLATLGKPIHITEFSAPSRSSKRKDPQPGLTDEEVAAWAGNFYTLAFSKPYISQLVCWNVVDGLGGRAIDAGLLSQDGRKKPLYHALRRLLKEEWTTRTRAAPDRGAFFFRGFFGTYEIAVDGYKPARVRMTAAGNREQTVWLEPR